MTLKRLPLLCLFLCGAALAAPEEGAVDFNTWLARFKQDALAQGISQAALDAALTGMQPLAPVLEKDQRQPEFVENFSNYLDKRLNPRRLARGLEALAEQRGLLEAVQARHGVPPAILVAFWGLETNYGTYVGNYPVPAALATLAYDNRRSAFFRNELVQALRIIDRGDVGAADMKGSWAGAVGQVQFMPSTYLRHAVDGDGDGRRDLWNSLPDVFNSAAHFLRELGWQPGEIWGREVRLPADFAWETARLDVKKTVKDWAALGVRQADGKPLPESDLAGAIVLPRGHAGPAFLVYRNFEVIMGWNRSTSYALSVGLLADRLLGLPPLQGGQDGDTRDLSREQVMDIQRRLTAQGYALGEPDGLVGAQTRQAIRAWQKSVGVPADGYASVGLLEQLQKAVP